VATGLLQTFHHWLWITSRCGVQGAEAAAAPLYQKGVDNTAVLTGGDLPGRLPGPQACVTRAWGHSAAVHLYVRSCLLLHYALPHSLCGALSCLPICLEQR